MTSPGKQSVVVGLIAAIFFVNKTASFVLDCNDPEYLPNLKNQVRPFYTLTSDPLTDLQEAGVCSFSDGNLVGRPRWPVYTLEPAHALMSTCPWGYQIDEDDTGFRFPCRIASARLILGDQEEETSPGHRQRCLTVPGTRHERRDRKVCKHLLQDVPVVTRTGCRNGINDYAIRNITITVGFTCTFDHIFHS